MRVLKRRRDERGAAMVEFALILPIFVALVFGIISYGFMLSYRQGLSQAASEGARAAAVAPSGTDRETRAREALQSALTYYEVGCAGDVLTRKGKIVGTCKVRVVSPCSSTNPAPCARITVIDKYRLNPLIPSFPGLNGTLPDNLTYTAVAEVN